MEMVPIKKIAEELGVNKDYALRLVKRRSTALGLRPQRGRRNAVSLSRDDADRLIRDYRPRLPIPASGNEIAKHSDFGYFYIIQLHPDDLPDRLKIGYTDNLDVRLSDHRTSAPTLELVRSWPCKRHGKRLQRRVSRESTVGASEERFSMAMSKRSLGVQTLSSVSCRVLGARR